MEEKLNDIGKRLDLTVEDVKAIRMRRIKDIAILAVVGTVTSFFSFVVGFSNGNTEKYGMAYYPYAVIPLVATRNYRGRWAVMGIGVVLMIIAGIFMYLQGFEAGKVFYSNSILYGVYSPDTGDRTD
jgi:protein-S-isoprenylcysteine O-methyltransferase Ste14